MRIEIFRDSVSVVVRAIEPQVQTGLFKVLRPALRIDLGRNLKERELLGEIELAVNELLAGGR